MSDDQEHYPIWKKIDEHSRLHTEAAKELAALKARTDAAEIRMDRLLQLQAEHRSESKADTAQIIKKIEGHEQKYHEDIGSINQTIDRARGGIITAAWIIGTGIAIATLIFAVVKWLI